MWPSAYSSGTPKFTWKSRNLLAGRRLGRDPVEDVAQPRDVDELVVVRKAIERQRRVGGPGAGPVLVRRGRPAMPRSASAADELGGVVRSVAVDDDLAVGA